MRRWYAGERLDGARYTRGEQVRIRDGARAGEAAEILALERLDPPTYLLKLADGGSLMVLESALS